MLMDAKTLALTYELLSLESRTLLQKLYSELQRGDG
jgi:hypothetical protein